MNRLNLTEKSPENVKFMIEQITAKLKMVNVSAIDASQYNEDCYEDLHDIYTMVMKRESFSPNEMQAIVEELGNLRN